MILLALAACAPRPEPLDLPADPAAAGAPVGVQTVSLDADLTLEIWYPAGDADADAPREILDFDAYVPASFTAAVGAFEFPDLESPASRDLALRVPEAPYPVVLFSHGLGGARIQSVDYTAHLASRGYVVVAADHVGRRMSDLLPCLLSPPLEGCDLSGTFEDPGPDDLAAALDWLERQVANPDSPWYGALDLERVGLSGHSAGGGTTAALGEEDPRFRSLLAMAGGAAVEREVPMMLMNGDCDAFAGEDSVGAAYSSLAQGAWVSLPTAGHLAFSDLCGLELAALADALLADREDLNNTLYGLLRQLATDGCPEGEPPATCPTDTYGDLGEAQEVVRHFSTRWFDLTLRGQGEALDAGLPAGAAFAGVEVQTQGL